MTAGDTVIALLVVAAVLYTLSIFRRKEVRQLSDAPQAADIKVFGSVPIAQSFATYHSGNSIIAVTESQFEQRIETYRVRAQDHKAFIRKHGRQARSSINTQNVDPALLASFESELLRCKETVQAMDKIDTETIFSEDSDSERFAKIIDSLHELEGDLQELVSEMKDAMVRDE